MHALGTPTEHAARSFVREHNISFLKRALRTEPDPDDRRVIRRLLREQERIYAAEPRDIEPRHDRSPPS
jgi:hypothetical protein